MEVIEISSSSSDESVHDDEDASTSSSATELELDPEEKVEQEPIEPDVQMEQTESNQEQQPTNGTDNKKVEVPPETNQGSKKKKKEKKTKDLTDPIKIVQSVLAKSAFKVPNLSSIVDEKFYHDPIYYKKLTNDLSTVVYEPKVGTVMDDFADINISVLPDNFHGFITVPPSAITTLSCINEVPQRRSRGKKGGKKGGAKSNAKNKQNVAPKQ